MANRKVPKPASSLKKNRFTFDLDIEEGAETVTRTFSIPKMGFVKPKVRREFAKAGQDPYDNMVEIFKLLDPELGSIAAELDADQLDWLAATWAEESGITPGESEASTDS